ncbi:hypothetical protein, partial [Thiolapillus sp.]
AQTIGSRSIRVTCSEEPDAGNPHVRFCEGESQQWPIYSTSPDLSGKSVQPAGLMPAAGMYLKVQASIGRYLMR